MENHNFSKPSLFRDGTNFHSGFGKEPSKTPVIKNGLSFYFLAPMVSP